MSAVLSRLINVSVEFEEAKADADEGALAVL